MSRILIGCCVFFLFLQVTVNAQPIEDRQEKVQSTSYGLKKHDFHMFYGITFFTPVSSEDSISYYKGTNLGFSMGFAYERLFGRHFAIGIEALPISYNWYTFKEDPTFRYPDTLSHKKEGYRGNVGQLGGYLRFSANRYDEIAGFHLDVGGNISIPYYYRYVQVDFPGQYKVKQITSRLDTEVYYSVFARLGFSFFDLYASYRLTDIFPNSTPFPQPPRIHLGIQIALPDFNPSY